MVDAVTSDFDVATPRRGSALMESVRRLKTRQALGSCLSGRTKRYLAGMGCRDEWPGRYFLSGDGALAGREGRPSVFCGKRGGVIYRYIIRANNKRRCRPSFGNRGRLWWKRRLGDWAPHTYARDVRRPSDCSARRTPPLSSAWMEQNRRAHPKMTIGIFS